MSSGSPGRKLCFALPPSLGAGPVRELARQFADVLYAAGFDTVIPTKTYGAMEQALLEGEVDAAWGPPIVCARVESLGGRVAMRAVRYGSVTYRSVLICRSGDDLDMTQLAQGVRQPRAAWVDAWSMGGCILPRAYLRGRHIDPAAAFASENMLGSYAACFEAVLEDEADVTASFAGRRGLGYVELCGERAFELRTIAYTGECPNDAVVIGPRLDDAQAHRLVASIHTLLGRPQDKSVLASMFDVDDFDVPAPGTYAPLLALL